jgi:hypothetical protein
VGLGAAALLVHGTLLTLCCVRVAEDAVTSTLFEPAAEISMMRVDPARYDVMRTVLGGVFFSLGLGVGALLLLAATHGAHVSTRGLVVALAAIAVAWGAVTLLQRRASGRAAAAGPPDLLALR